MRRSSTVTTDAEPTGSIAGARSSPDDNDPEIYGYFGYVDRLLRQWAAGIDPTREPLDRTEGLFYRTGRSLRADPRVMTLAARYALGDYWHDTDHWPDFCREEALPYDCKEAALEVRVQAAAQ
jgi:hypothetical protein